MDIFLINTTIIVNTVLVVLFTFRYSSGLTKLSTISCIIIHLLGLALLLHLAVFEYPHFVPDLFRITGSNTAVRQNIPFFLINDPKNQFYWPMSTLIFSISTDPALVLEAIMACAIVLNIGGMKGYIIGSNPKQSILKKLTLRQLNVFINYISLVVWSLVLLFPAVATVHESSTTLIVALHNQYFWFMGWIIGSIEMVDVSSRCKNVILSIICVTGIFVSLNRISSIFHTWRVVVDKYTSNIRDRREDCFNARPENTTIPRFKLVTLSPDHSKTFELAPQQGSRTITGWQIFRKRYKTCILMIMLFSFTVTQGVYSAAFFQILLPLRCYIFSFLSFAEVYVLTTAYNSYKSYLKINYKANAYVFSNIIYVIYVVVYLVVYFAVGRRILFLFCWCVSFYILFVAIGIFLAFGPRKQAPNLYRMLTQLENPESVPKTKAWEHIERDLYDIFTTPRNIHDRVSVVSHIVHVIKPHGMGTAISMAIYTEWLKCTTRNRYFKWKSKYLKCCIIFLDIYFCLPIILVYQWSISLLWCFAVVILSHDDIDALKYVIVGNGILWSLQIVILIVFATICAIVVNYALRPRLIDSMVNPIHFKPFWVYMIIGQWLYDYGFVAVNDSSTY